MRLRMLRGWAISATTRCGFTVHNRGRRWNDEGSVGVSAGGRPGVIKHKAFERLAGGRPSLIKRKAFEGPDRYFILRLLHRHEFSAACYAHAHNLFVLDVLAIRRDLSRSFGERRMTDHSDGTFAKSMFAVVFLVRDSGSGIVHLLVGQRAQVLVCSQRPWPLYPWQLHTGSRFGMPRHYP
eukprot:3100916-Rhodomonas_salina.1